MMLQERRRIAQLNRANWFNNRNNPRQNQGPYSESNDFNFGPGYGEYGYEGFGPEGYYGRDFYYDFRPGFDRFGYEGFGPDWYYGYEYDEFLR